MRAAVRLGWTLVLTVGVCGSAWLLFGDEPAVADKGAINPLALVAPALALLFGVLLMPQILGLVRRPALRADSFALTMRPGSARTLVLPWGELAEIATAKIEDEYFLLVRCSPGSREVGDSPQWWDQAPLRAARRGAPAAAVYDLAMPMSDFDGSPGQLLIELATVAPASVVLVNAVL